MCIWLSARVDEQKNKDQKQHAHIEEMHIQFPHMFQQNIQFLFPQEHRGLNRTNSWPSLQSKEVEAQSTARLFATDGYHVFCCFCLFLIDLSWLKSVFFCISSLFFFDSRMRSEGFSFNSEGLGVGSCSRRIVSAPATVRNRPQPFATVCGRAIRRSCEIAWKLVEM